MKQGPYANKTKQKMFIIWPFIEKVFIVLIYIAKALQKILNQTPQKRKVTWGWHPAATRGPGVCSIDTVLTKYWRGPALVRIQMTSLLLPHLLPNVILSVK